MLRAASAREYRALAPSLLPAVLAAFERLAADADLVLVEGAGSPAEINLRAGDIANMGFAEAADVPVALVGDIDRGGVIAQLVGTHALLAAAERARLAGYIVNKFRGDMRLFDGGLAAIGERTGLPCFGVVPWFPEAHLLPAEDSMALACPHPPSPAVWPLPLPRAGEGFLRRHPRPLSRSRERVAPGTAQRRVRASGSASRSPSRCCRVSPISTISTRCAPSLGSSWSSCGPGDALPGDAALVILPGSKATLADLAALRREGWDIDILAHRRRGGQVLGICGGYQMLGHGIADPGGHEGPPGEAPGLGLLDIDTVLGGEKRLGLVERRRHRQRRAGRRLRDASRRDHRRRARPADAAPRRPRRRRGQRRRQGRRLLSARALRQRRVPPRVPRPARRARRARSPTKPRSTTTLDALADHLEASLDLDAILAAARPPRLNRAA